jgi:hypothetical protein
MTQRHIVSERDGRELEFEGTLLGSASSRRDDSERWAEVEIYRTVNGRYIVAGFGKTLRPGERERRWAHVCEEAVGVIETLYREDSDGVRYLTRVNREAIREAACHDDELARAFGREVVA